MMAVGEGWFTYKWNGATVVEHGGDLPGAHSMMTLLPARRAGIFISVASQGASSGRSSDPLFLHPRQINNDLLAALLGPRAIGNSGSPSGQAEIPPGDLAGRYVVARGAYHSVEFPRQVLEVRAAGGNLEIEGVGLLRPLSGNLFAGPGKLIWDAAAFRRAADGSIVLFPNFPFTAFQKVPVWRDPGYATMLADAGLALLATAFALPFYRDDRPGARQAKWLPIVAFLYLASMAAAALLPMWNGRTLQDAYEDGSQHGFILLIVLAHLILVLAVACTIEARDTWRRRFWGQGRWGLAARIHYTALALAAWAPIPLFLHMHLLGWHLP